MTALHFSVFTQEWEECRAHDGNCPYEDVTPPEGKSFEQYVEQQAALRAQRAEEKARSSAERRAKRFARQNAWRKEWRARKRAEAAASAVAGEPVEAPAPAPEPVPEPVPAPEPVEVAPEPVKCAKFKQVNGEFVLSGKGLVVGEVITVLTRRGEREVMVTGVEKTRGDYQRATFSWDTPKNLAQKEAERQAREAEKAAQRAQWAAEKKQAEAERQAGIREAAKQQAIFRKVNGEWRIAGPGLAVGETATVTKKDGSTQEVLVLRVLSTDEEGVSTAHFSRVPERQHPAWMPEGTTARFWPQDMAVVGNIVRGEIIRAIGPASYSDEEDPSLHGSYWLGHEGERGYSVAVEQATPEEIAAYEAEKRALTLPPGALRHVADFPEDW